MTINARVLVLNKAFMPVGVANAERAFGLLYSGAAQALDDQYQMFDYESWSELAAKEGDDVVRTVDRVLKIPRVVVLQVFDKFPRRVVRFSRQNVYLRDKFTCQYCGNAFARHKLNLDHVLPQSQGGRTTWENIVCSCIDCNTKKGGRTPEEARMPLLRAPAKPKWHDLHSSKQGTIPYAEWVPFINPTDAAYWNTELKE